MNEELIRHLAEKNHEVWRADVANAKNRFNVAFDELPEKQKESAMNDARVIVGEYEKVMVPVQAAQAEVAQVKPKPLPPKGKMDAVIEKVFPGRQRVEVPVEPLAEDQTSLSEVTQTPPTPAPAPVTTTPIERIDSALRYIAEQVRALPEAERRRLSGLSIQNLAFNATNGDFLLAVGLLHSATTELPTFFNAVIAQRQAAQVAR